MNATVPQLIQNLEHTASDVEMKQTMDALVQKGSESVPDLLSAVGNLPQRKGLRRTVTQIFQRIGYPSNTAAIPFLVGIASDINSPGWENALTALKEAGEPILPQVHEAIQFYSKDYDQYGLYFQGLCTLLEEMGSPIIDSLLPDLLQLLEVGTSDNFIDEYALWPLSKIGSPKADAAVSILKQKIQAKDQGEVRPAFILALQYFDLASVKQLAPVLYECLSNPSIPVQESARKILSLIEDLE